MTPEAQQASAKAVAFTAQSVNCLRAYARLGADEGDRWVFIVYYELKLPCRPAPYIVVSIQKASGVAAELNWEEAEPYRPRGYK